MPRSSPSVAIIGAGYWGVNHVRTFSELGALSIVHDTSTATLETIGKAYGVRTTTDLHVVLDDPDISGVVIATPAETHFKTALAAIDSGKDVLVEKPLALTAADGQRLIAAAEDRGVILMVGHLLEYHPAFLRLRELVDSGYLGDLRYIYSARLNLGKIRREENILWSFAPHDIALILRLVGANPVTVTASGGAYLQPKIADVTVTNIEFPNGVRAHIFVSWLHPFKEQRLVVIGSKRMAVFDDVAKDHKLVVYDQGVDFVDGLPVARKGDGVPEPIDSEEPLRRECSAFIDAMKTRRRPLTDGASGLKVLWVLEAAEQSLAENGLPVHS